MQDYFLWKILNVQDRKRECRVFFFFLKNGKYALDRSRTSSPLIDGSTGFDFRPKKQFIGGKNSRETLFEEVWYRVLGSCSFQGCGFHLCAFAKKIQNIWLMRFFNIVVKEFLPSLMRIVINFGYKFYDFTHAYLAHAYFCQI